MIFLYLIAILLIIFLYRTISTGLNYRSIQRESDKFEKWLSDNDESVKAPNGEKMRHLMKAVNITQSPVPYTEAIGPQLIRNSTMDGLKSYPTKDRQILKQLLPIIYYGIDTHQYKFRQNFNPMFWIDFVLYLPKQIIEYLGLNSESTFAKLLNILYWFITPLLIIFREKLWEILLNFFS